MRVARCTTWPRPLEIPYAFGDIDEASAELILRLQLDELEDLKGTRPGKQREGEKHDSDVAATLFEEDLESLRSLLADRCMTKSIATAVQADGAILAHTTAAEQTACEDHVFAHQLNGSNVTSGINLQPKCIDDSILSKLIGRFVSEDVGHAFDAGYDHPNSSDGDTEPESSAWAALNQRRHETGALNRQCEACREPKKYFDLIAAPCRHEYCRDCLRELFNASLTDESLFPPRCCRVPISIQSVEIFLTKKLKEKFEEKKVEFGTPNRTYCCRQTCSTFISGDNISEDTAICPVCLTETCVVCKAEAHSGRDCPNDTALQQVVELAEEHGWQRCYACRRMVELDVGCNHMTYARFRHVIGTYADSR